MKYLFFILLFLSSFIAKSQFVIEKKVIQDSAYTIPMFTTSYAYQWSGADMADRFTANSNVGGSFMVKTKNNWIYGFKGSFLFGASVTDSTVLRNIVTNDGYIIDNEGRLTDVYLGQRGSSFFAFGGKMINKLAPNKNSGFLFYGGIGMLQHKISIKFQDEAASLTEDHKKGYDRFSIGYAVNGFVGYLFLSKNRLLNLI